jgi:large subunit ribosomal protein L15
MQRRLPKRGFRNPLADKVANVNVGDLEVFADGAEVNATTLKASGLVRGRYDVLKVLGEGELTRKLIVHAHRFSKGAVAKIEKAGGKIVMIAPPAAKGNKGTAADASTRA